MDTEIHNGTTGRKLLPLTPDSPALAPAPAVAGSA
jgi:hypothetical protein